MSPQKSVLDSQLHKTSGCLLMNIRSLPGDEIENAAVSGGTHSGRCPCERWSPGRRQPAQLWKTWRPEFKCKAHVFHMGACPCSHSNGEVAQGSPGSHPSLLGKFQSTEIPCQKRHKAPVLLLFLVLWQNILKKKSDGGKTRFILTHNSGYSLPWERWQEFSTVSHIITQSRTKRSGYAFLNP